MRHRRGTDLTLTTQDAQLAAAARAVGLDATGVGPRPGGSHPTGVRRAHVVDGRRPGALLEEVFTAEGSGTLVLP